MVSWFFVLNSKKCHFITLGNGSNLCNFSCDGIIIKNSLWDKTLGLTIDNNLDLVITSLIYSKLQIKNWMLYSGYQLICGVFCDLVPFVQFKKREKRPWRSVNFSKVAKSLFSYCPLIWMFCNRKSMNKVNKIQERHLRLMANNYEISYDELPDLTTEISPHQRFQWLKYTNALIDFPLILWIYLQFQITGTILDTTTFLLLIGPKPTDMVKIQFHIELIRYGTYCPVK